MPLPEPAATRSIFVSIPSQRLWVLDERGNVLREYPVSTAAAGPGVEENSNRTPTGRLRVARKIGRGAPPDAMFKSREIVGFWDGQPLEEDGILGRILWLEGLDPENANTFRRYIYIHGTNHEDKIGEPASHGCVRMTRADVVELFDLVEEGTPVTISAGERDFAEFVANRRAAGEMI